MNTFITLLKREFWEHRGGMLWAPLAVGGLMLALVAVSIVSGLLGSGGELRISGELRINGQPLLPATPMIDPAAQAALEEGMASAKLHLALLPSMLPLAIVLAFVVLFYALGSLYEDRRDKSVLFWASMPVSNSATVLSKLVSIAVVTPLLAALVGIVVGMLAALDLAITMSVLGSGTLPRLLSDPDFLLAPLAVLALLPVYALWALPSIAWCMAVSAWARRAPLLWAIGMPVFAGSLVSWQEAMFNRDLGGDWFWENVVARLFGGFVPGLWFAFAGDGVSIEALEPEPIGPLGLVAESYATLASPALWIGLIVGAGLIALAIRLRRWREDAA